MGWWPRSSSFANRHNELGRHGTVVGAVERVDRDIADADALVGEHVVDRDRGWYPAAGRPGRNQPLPGVIGRIDVAGVEDLTQLVVIERVVEIPWQNPEHPPGLRSRQRPQVTPPIGGRVAV